MISDAVITIVSGIVCSVIATYIVRFIDNKRKNDRHSPKSGH